MKTLFLKDRQTVKVKTGTGVENSGYIAVYENYDNQELRFTILKTASAGMRCELPEGKNFLAWDEITIAHEIAENFHQYFNNLNQ